MKLSLHLFKEGVKGFDGLIIKDQSGKDNYVEIKTEKDLPYKCRAYIQRNKPSTPKWASFLGSHFNKEELNVGNSTNSFVLFLEVSGRVFAATFGFGFSAIDRTQLEPRFGLKASLNSIEPQKIRSLDTRTIDLVTRQRRTHLNVASPVTQFEINDSIDWIKHISGIPLSNDLGTKISGADSLSINCKCELVQLADKCNELLGLFKSDGYKSQFPFIDHLAPISSKDAVVRTLDAKLIEKITNRVTDRFATAYPDLEFASRPELSQYVIYAGRKRSVVDEVSTDALFDYFKDASDPEGLLGKAKVVALDDAESAVTSPRSLYDFIVCEVDLNSELYILSLGQWFKVERSYANSVRAQVKSIEDATVAFAMPAWTAAEKKEGEYNKKVGIAKDWLVFDQKLISATGSGRNAIEVCDLLTKGGDFICVKKMSSSATLSHLFSQATVSASHLRSSEDFRKKFAKAVNKKWPDVSYEDHKFKGKFVYAIHTKKPGPLADCLFFFSMINLLDHKRQLSAMGFDVALCKIP